MTGVIRQSHRNFTSRPLIIILGLKFLSLFLDKVMGSRLYIVAHLFATLGEDHYAHVMGQPRPPTALQWGRGREKAATLHPTTVHAADQASHASVCVFITSQGHSWTLLCLKEEALQAVVHLT